MMKTIFFRCFLAAELVEMDGDDDEATGVRSVMVSNCMGRSWGIIKGLSVKIKRKKSEDFGPGTTTSSG